MRKVNESLNNHQSHDYDNDLFRYNNCAVACDSAVVYPTNCEWTDVAMYRAWI